MAHTTSTNTISIPRNATVSVEVVCISFGINGISTSVGDNIGSCIYVITTGMESNSS